MRPGPLICHQRRAVDSAPRLGIRSPDARPRRDPCSTRRTTSEWCRSSHRDEARRPRALSLPSLTTVASDGIRASFRFRQPRLKREGEACPYPASVSQRDRLRGRLVVAASIVVNPRPRHGRPLSGQQRPLNLYGGGPAASDVARARNSNSASPASRSTGRGFSNRSYPDRRAPGGQAAADIALRSPGRTSALIAKAPAGVHPDGWETIAAQFKDPDGAFSGPLRDVLRLCLSPDLVNVTVRSPAISSIRRSRPALTLSSDDDITLYHYARWSPVTGFMDDS